MQRKKAVLAILLVAIVVVSSFVAYNVLSPKKQLKPFYVGIETGWKASVADCEALIDKVKGYDNLYLIASPLIVNNETALNQVCDYAYNAGMYFMPVYYEQFFTSSFGFTPSLWFSAAKEKYGDRLLGVYYYDEDAGNQLDTNVIIPNPVLTSPPQSYLDYSNYFYWLWTHGNSGVAKTAAVVQDLNSSLYTSDYGLYWFDYDLGYNTILAQFGWNNSRPLQISLVRGAAEARNTSWGAIITWTYNGTDNGGIYLEPPAQMYSDMILAYDSGATYVAIYDSTQDYTNTTLTNEAYFTKLQEFWNYVKQNPEKQGSLKADTAVVLPQDYGFGFRSQDDSVWQQHIATAWTQQLYANVASLLSQYKSGLNIVYGDPQFQSVIQSQYSKILYWPVDFENGATYKVTDLNNSLGYNTIQDALSSFATNQGDTVLVKSGTYQENIVVTKPVALTSQNQSTTVIEGTGNGTALSIAASNVTVTGFTIRNSGYPSTAEGTGILLENAHNCTVNGNIVTGNYVGALIVNSTYNVFRSNQISGNTYNLILQNSENNDIDASNTINGEPYAAD